MGDTTNRDSGSLRVTIKDVFEAVQSSNQSLARLEGTLTRLDAQTGENTKDISDHEQRIRSLEAWRYALPASTILGAIGALGTVLVAVLK